MSGAGLTTASLVPMCTLPEELDASVANPLAVLLANPPDPRVVVLRVWPRDSNGVEQELWISNVEYATHHDDDPANVRAAALLDVPYSVEVDLTDSAGWLAPYSRPSPGVAQVRDPLGVLGTGLVAATWPITPAAEVYRWTWQGSRAEVWVGAEGAPWSTFGRIQRAVVGKVSWDLDGNLRLPLLAGDATLASRVVSPRYRGFGRALRFDGVGDLVEIGDHLDPASSSFFVFVRFRVGESGLLQTVVSKKANAGGTAPGFAIYQEASDSFLFRICNGATQQDVRASAANLGDVVTLVAVVDRESGTQRIYKDLDPFNNKSLAGSFGSLASTSPMRLMVQGGGGFFATGDVLEAAWGYRVPTDEEITAWVDRPLDPVVDSCIVWPINEGAGGKTEAKTPVNGAAVGVLTDGVNDVIEVAHDPSLTCQTADLPLRLRAQCDRISDTGQSYQTVLQKSQNYRFSYLANGQFRAEFFADDGTLHVWIWPTIYELKVTQEFDVEIAALAAGGATFLVDSEDQGAGSYFTQSLPQDLTAVLSIGAGVGAVNQRRHGTTWRCELWISDDLRLHLPLSTNTGTVVTDLSAYGNDGTLTGATWVDLHGTITGATWAATDEGVPELDTYRPAHYGERRHARPVQLDPLANLWQAHHAETKAIDEMYQQGVAGQVVPDTPAEVTYDEITDMATNPAAEGTYVTHLARGLVRFGILPATPVTMDLRGDAQATGRTAGYVDEPADLVVRLVTEAGYLWPDDFDVATVTALANATTGLKVGVGRRAGGKLVELLTEVMRSVNGWWTTGRQDQFRFGLLRSPGAPTSWLEGHDVVSAQRLETVDAFWNLMVEYREHDPSLSIDSLNADLLSEREREEIARLYRHVSRRHTTVTQEDALAGERVIRTGLVYSHDAATMRDVVYDLLTSGYDLWRLRLSAGLWQYDVGSAIGLRNMVTDEGVLLHATLAGEHWGTCLGYREVVGRTAAADQVSLVLYTEPQ